MGPTVRHSRSLFLLHFSSPPYWYFFSPSPLFSFLSFFSSSSWVLSAASLFLFFFLFFFFTVGFFHLLLFFLFLFSFLFFFFTLVSFLLFLHVMMAEMAEGFDFSCDLHFNRVKVCFLGLELWILWCNFFGISFCFYFHYIYAKEFAMMLKVLVDGFDFWWFVWWWMQNNGDGLGFCELQLGVCGLLEVVEAKNGRRNVSMFQASWKRRGKKNERDEGERHVTVLICTVHGLHHFVKILS